MEKEYCINCEFNGYQAEVYTNGPISRCLRCGRSTEKEIPAKVYWEMKQKKENE